MSVSETEFLEWINVKRDPSTGLGTLVALFEALERHLGSMDPGRESLSLLHLDLDQLSRLNSDLGRTAGDEMIAHLVECIGEVIDQAGDGRTMDCLYRMGGDEFALLLPDTSIDEAAGLADRIRDAFERKNTLDGQRPATVSIGAAAVPVSAHDLGSLVTAADMGVLEAKREGGNAVRPQRQAPLAAREMHVASRLINMLARRMVETGGLLEEAQKFAFTDPITGLPNHRALNRFLEQEHLRAMRYHHPYSVLLVDGDALKLFNDSLGREAGNDWIRRLGRLLSRYTRSTDRVARWFTGDEFVVVMTETGVEEAFATAERIRQEVQQEGEAMPIPATVSIGVAAYPQDGANPKELLERADRANAEAKRRGRNRVMAYGSLSKSETETL